MVEGQMTDCVLSLELKHTACWEIRQVEKKISRFVPKSIDRAFLVLGILSNEWTINMSCWVTMISSDLEWIPDIEIGQSAMFLWTVLENVLEINQIKIITSTITRRKWRKCEDNEISKSMNMATYSQIVLNFNESLFSFCLIHNFKYNLPTLPKMHLCLRLHYKQLENQMKMHSYICFNLSR